MLLCFILGAPHQPNWVLALWTVSSLVGLWQSPLVIPLQRCSPFAAKAMNSPCQAARWVYTFGALKPIWAILMNVWASHSAYPFLGLLFLSCLRTDHLLSKFYCFVDTLSSFCFSSISLRPGQVSLLYGCSPRFAWTWILMPASFSSCRAPEFWYPGLGRCVSSPPYLVLSDLMTLGLSC